MQPLPDTRATLLARLRDPADGEAWREFTRLYAGVVYGVARRRGRFTASTWKAFWGTAVDGRNPKEVGGELGLSPGAVYVAKSRVLARLRDKVRELDEE